MRQSIRGPLREGFQRDLCVCGAWHAPAMETAVMPPVKDDCRRHQDGPKVKGRRLGARTHGVLSASGLETGLTRQGYHHLWTARAGWSDVDNACRSVAPREDLDASAAPHHRGGSTGRGHGRDSRPRLPDLSELKWDAVAAVSASRCPRALVHDQADRRRGTMGRVPPDIPTVPLQPRT